MYKNTFLHPETDLNIYLKYSAPEKDRILLFLHGYPDTHKTWDVLMNQLAKKYQVAAIDLRGAGESSRPTERSAFNIRRIYKDIETAIRFLDPKGEKNVHLVGHDWGSLIGWCFASDPISSGYISSFTGIAGPHPALARKQMESYAKRGIWSWNTDEISRFFKQGTMSWYVLFFQFPILPELGLTFGSLGFWHALLQAGGVPKSDPMWDYGTKEILRSCIGPIQMFRELIQGEQIGIPNKIETPCQAIVPINDFAITPEIYENLSEHALHFRKNFLDANHWVHREKPEEVAKLIDSFCKNVENAEI
ncbi:alpha/beta fold hydrolase [Leptospira sp. GIMC2001]|uniref:alpha/beta fold hydrolase n=1 Tax=Leptospira sp. GIMC2001 TaxID=1513297 RepID=UPI00234BEF98|nr:alpha/beta fold hydrolase [Leptospira sp. GIMC2001]WCL49419.1 alpha/beta fold hydrolase [Leptospira sp. GIMC2001]